MPSSNTTTTTSLSARGRDLASGPSMRKQASNILSKQWHPVENPDGVVNIGTAENHLVIDDVAEFIRSKDLNLRGEDIDYGEGPWGSARLRGAMAAFMNRYFIPHTLISADDLTCANGCSAIFNMLGLALGDPGDGFLLSTPNYVAFPSDFGILAKMTHIPVPIPQETYFDPSSVAQYETALERAKAQGTRVRALILCNPHNPRGKCYPRSTLAALLGFCNRHKIHLVSDEIYALSVYDVPGEAATPFTSVLALDYSGLVDDKYVHVVYGMSKDFAAGGLRIGALHTRNQELSRALDAASSFHWPGAVDQMVAATILEDVDFVPGFLERSRETLGRAGGLARMLLEENEIPYAAGSNAGLFLWVDLGKWMDGGKGWQEEEQMLERMKREKVFLTAGRGQNAERPGWFRFVFSRDEVVVREGINRLVKCLET